MLAKKIWKFEWSVITFEALHIEMHVHTSKMNTTCNDPPLKSIYIFKSPSLLLFFWYDQKRLYVNLGSDIPYSTHSKLNHVFLAIRH